MRHGARRIATLGAVCGIAAFLWVAALPGPAGAGVFRITDSGVDNDLIVGFDTLVWRHDADLVKYVDTPAHDYLTLAPAFGGNVASSAQVGPDLYFADQHTLWKSNGTQNSALEVATLEPTSLEHTVTNLSNLNGTLFFRGYTQESRFEPWISRGQETLTAMVKDIYPGPTSGMGAGVVSGNYAYFEGDDGVHGIEPWVSNGQEAGTSMILDVNPAGSSSPHSFTTCDANVYFSADDGVNGRALWRTDGSAAGTFRLTDGLEPIPYTLTCVGRLLYFTGYSAANARNELWVYDPLEPPAVLVKGDWDDCSGCGPQIHTFRAVNNVLLFAAKDAGHGTELWRSDGSPAGTVMVKDLWPGLDYSGATPYPNSSDPYDLAVNGGKLYFRASHPDFGGEVWVSDGTADGTWPVTDILPGPGNTWPSDLTAAGQNVFFRVQGDGSYNVWGLSVDTPPYRDLVRNGSFEDADTGASWTLLKLSAALDKRVCNQRSLERCSFKIAGSATGAKALRQIVYANGTDRGAAGQLISLSGWSKAVGVSAAGGFYGLEFVVNYSDGTKATKRVSFTRATHPWQYKRVALKAAKSWSRVTIYVRYLNQAGTAWFDDLRLTVR